MAKRPVFDDPTTDEIDIDAAMEAAKTAELTVAPEPGTEPVSTPSEEKPPPATEPVAADIPSAEPTAIAAEGSGDSFEQKYHNLQTALKAEREERQRAVEAYNAMQAQLSQLEPLRQEIAKKQQDEALAAEQAAFEENPAEYLRKQQAALAQRMEGYAQQQTQQAQQYQQLQEFHTSVSTEASEFAKQNPDYLDAFEFVRQRRMDEYGVLGVDPARAAQLFDQESWGFAIQARQNRRSAPEMVMQLAKVWGFNPEAKRPPGGDAIARAHGAGPMGTVTNITDKVRRMEAGMRASGTLSDGIPAETSVLKKIETMSDKEFDEFWDKEVDAGKKQSF